MMLLVASLLGGCSSYEPEAGEPEDEVCTCVVDLYGADGELDKSVVETYDASGHLIRSEGRLQSSWPIVDTYTFEGDLLVRHSSDVDGAVGSIRYEHDDQGRFVQATYDEGPIAGLRVELAYNAFGVESSRRVGSEGELFAETLYQRDADGRLMGWDGYSGADWQAGAVRTYEAASPSLDHVEVRSYVNQGSQSTVRGYDSERQLIEELVTSSFGSETLWLYAYNDKGMLSEVSYDDDFSPTVVTYTYDAAGREVLRESVPATEGGYNGGRIERVWRCRDQPALPTPTMPGVTSYSIHHPLLGWF